MKTCNVYFLLIFILLIALSSTKAQTVSKKANVNIIGEVKTPISLAPLAMDKMGKTAVVAKDHNEKEHTYTGVELYVLLEEAGVTLWPELMGKNLTKYLLIKASDGYQVVFSLAEVDPEFSDKKIVLANRKDGELLSAEEGPFHIIIAGEKRKPRFIRQVISIEVKYDK
jgi:hypothetical protein